MTPIKINAVRNILVPTDFSENANQAMDYACELASVMCAKLFLINAFHIPAIVTVDEASLLSISNAEKDSQSKLGGVKKDILKTFPGLQVETISANGFAVDEIVLSVAEKKIDLVIMGTKGASGLAEMLIGSNTAEVIEKAACPVLALPSEAKFTNVNKIVFATNYEDNDFQTLFLLTEMFKPFKPEIIILHVEEDHNPQLESRMLEWFKGQVITNIPYNKLSFNLISGKNISQSLNEFLVENEINLFAMSTKKRGFVEKLFHKSLTKKFAYHTHIPLLAFHAYRINN
ncbi:MAG: universal stress protein [Bacteroidetes bacterium]|nr:universal stress protein [Bacteroidota bacterium]